MKTIFKFSLFLISTLTFGLSYAQTHRFSYEYQFYPSLEEGDSLRTEIMHLDIDNDTSIFFSDALFKNDSINNLSIIKQKKISPNSISISSHLKYWNQKYLIKKHANKKISHFTSFNDNAYELEEKVSLNWKISSENKTIGKYNCQKATADFGGRHWTAWFTSEIPIPEGPYKFSGLPGLIIDIIDNTGTHHFSLKGNQQLKSDQNSWDYIESLKKEAGNIVNFIKVNRKNMNKLWITYLKDPVSQLRIDLADPNMSMVLRIDNGKEVSDKTEIIKMMEESEKNIIKRTNNSIEIDLFPPEV